MPTSDSHDYDLIDRLAEEFAKRFRDGERPSIQEYCDKYPHIAADLREMLPALAEVEQVKDEVAAPPAAEPPKLREIGEYHILREVGRGGMGVVYEADDTRLGRRVALKVLATGKAGHALERFKREARAAARLHHTNIVPVFGVGDHDGLPYYVMQFIQGLGLDEVLDEVKRLQSKSGSTVLPSAVRSRARKDISAVAVARSLVTGTFEPPANPEAFAETRTHVGQVSNLSNSTGRVGNLSHGSSSSAISLPGQSTLTGRKPTYWQSVAQIGLQVADALDYAHKQGDLHRDIKPSNLLLDLHGVVWVTDFGLAKAADQEDLTHTGDVLGTLRYMPPEAFEGKSEARSDVYSLGLTMYELLALRPAYDERKKEQLVKQVTTTDPPRLGTFNRSIPRDLQTIVHKAIEKDPEHRYKSAADLAADLRRFLADQTILARRVSPGERFARWCKRNPTVAPLTAAVFLLVTSVALVSSVLAIRIEQKANEAHAEAERANGEADRKELALEEAAKERRRTEELVGEQFVHRGAVMLTEGDVAGAALCFAQALKLDPNVPDRALTHRIRLAAALRDAPRPRHAFFHDARVICAVPNRDGKLLATGCGDRTVRVWDLATGERVGPVITVNDDIDFVNFAAQDKRLWILTKPAAPAEIAPDDPPEETSKFEASLWERETGRMIFSGRRNYGTQFAGFDRVTGKGIVAFNPEPNILEMRDRDTGELKHPATRLPGPNAFSTASFPANREIVAIRVEVKRPEPKAPEGKAVEPKATRPRRKVYEYEYRVYDHTTGEQVFTIGHSPISDAYVCGADDRQLVVLEPGWDAFQWYDLATGRKGPRVILPKAPYPRGSGFGAVSPPQVSISGDHRRVVVSRPSRSSFNGVAVPTPVLVLDADTGTEVTAPFTVTPGPQGPSIVRVVPNLDASRFLVLDGTAQLLRGDGTPLTDQPDTAAGAGVGFSPDGGFFVTVGIDNSVRVWDAWTGKPATPKLPHDAPVRIIDFTPDGSHVRTISGSVVRLWPLARKDQGRGLPLANTSVERILSDDGNRILEYPSSRGFPANGGEVRVIDSATGQTIAGPIRLPVDDAQMSRMTTAQFRPDGRAALILIRETSSGEDGFRITSSRALLWDCESGKTKELWGLDVTQNGAAAFSPDGRFVRTSTLSGDKYRMQLRDAVSGEPVGDGIVVPAPKQTGPKRGGPPLEALAFGTWSPDSSVLVYRDSAAHVLRRFDARTGAELGPSIAHDPYLDVLTAFSDDSRRLLTTETQPLRGRSAKGEGVPGPDAATGRIRLWDARTGQPIGPPLTGARLGGVVVSATLNPAGDRVAVIVPAPSNFQGIRSARDASNGLAVHLWDPAAGRPVTPPLVHDHPATQLVFSPDGQWLLTATDHDIRLWSTNTGEQLRAIPVVDIISGVAFNQDGRRIVVTMGQPFGPPPTRRSFVQVWDSRTGQPMTPPLQNTAPFGPGGFGRPYGNSPRGNRSRSGDKLLVYRDDGTQEVYSLAVDDRPVGELVRLTEVLSARQVNTAGVIQGLGPAGFRESWEATRPKFASEWSNPAVEGSDWDRWCIPPTFGGLRASALAPFAGRGSPEQWSQYLWHLDRLVLAEPDNAALHAARAYLLNNRGDHAAAEAAFTRAIDLKSDGRKSLLVGRANARAELGKWADAEADLVESLNTPVLKGGFSPTPFESAQLGLALLHLRRGDLAAYKADCVKLVGEGKAGFGTFRSWPTSLWAVLLADGAVPNLKDLVPGADSESFSRPFDLVNDPMSLRLAAYYRLGRFADVEKLFPSISSPSRADLYFLAMAQHRQGKPEARATLEKANATKSVVPPWTGTSIFTAIRSPASGWQRQVAEEVLRKEAEGLILGKK